MPKQKILFLDVDNSGVSQIMEGIIRNLYSDRFEAYSAGIVKGRLNMDVVKIMNEIGIDLFSYRSKNIDEIRDINFDYIVCTNDSIKNALNFLPNGKIYLYTDFAPFPQVTSEKNKKQINEQIRAERDLIKAWVIDNFGRGCPSKV